MFPIFQCFHCGFSTKFRSSLARHVKRRHINPQSNLPQKNIYRCSMCSGYDSKNRKNMVLHYVKVHDVFLRMTNLRFASQREFMEWKEQVEKQDRSRFVKVRGTKVNKTHSSCTYRCHREGFFHSKGKGKRKMKVYGSHKINSCCPAEMVVRTFNSDGTVDVKYISTHFAHDQELWRLYLSKTDKDLLAKKLSESYSFDSVLNFARDGICDDQLERLQLLTRKDLKNIVRDYNLKCEVSSLSNIQSGEPGTSFHEEVVTDVTVVMDDMAEGLHDQTFIIEESENVNEDFDFEEGMRDVRHLFQDICGLVETKTDLDLLKEMLPPIIHILKQQKGKVDVNF